VRLEVSVPGLQRAEHDGFRFCGACGAAFAQVGDIPATTWARELPDSLSH